MENYWDWKEGCINQIGFCNCFLSSTLWNFLTDLGNMDKASHSFFGKRNISPAPSDFSLRVYLFSAELCQTTWYFYSNTQKQLQYINDSGIHFEVIKCRAVMQKISQN